MRSLLRVWVLSLLVISGSLSQQFYRSKGLSLFNQGQYHAAIDSLLHWADIFTGERGIAYYYVGECYYNLGLDETIPSQAISSFKKGIGYFEQAARQTDLSSLYPEKKVEALYKKAWSYYRLAELESDPLLSLIISDRTFTELSSSFSDTTGVYALYMAGETRLRIADWKRIQMFLSANVGQSIILAQEALQSIRSAESAFKQVADSKIVSSYLRSCALLQYQNSLFEEGKLYQKMDPEVFGELKDSRQEKTPEETAIKTFYRVNYRSVLNSMNSLSKVRFKPIITYSEAVKYLNLYLLTGEVKDKQSLNSTLDSLKWVSFRDEKFFIEANRDHRESSEDESFLNLADSTKSFYAKAGKDFPEAWYWLGWVQFVVNARESETQFERFLQDTQNSFSDPRLTALREDAKYRIFLLRFDQYAANTGRLKVLKKEIEKFNPRYPFVQDRVKLLLQLVRVGLGEPIWGQILQAPSTGGRLKDAFILIRNMMVRAARVTGRERVPYLKYLDKLFQITQDRSSDATSFYRGFSLFLKAEIQETSRAKRKFYFSAADALRLSRGKYQQEGMYVQARSYFAAAKHESTPDKRNSVYAKAKPLFVQLINNAKSLRSVYYLGEIFRIERNDLAARRCYEVVMKKTKGKRGGEFWYNNALAGMESCGSAGNLTRLKGIKIDEVVFPEKLLVEDGEEISLERFADQDYIRKQYWQEAIDLLMKFGLPKLTIYPSAFRLSSSRFNTRAYRMLSVGIHERVGNITSGIQLQVIFPAGVPQDVTVSLDGIQIAKNNKGFYQKKPLPLNQVVEIKVNNSLCYPFLEMHRLTQPGLERRVVYLVRKTRFVPSGIGVESGVNVINFPKRVDGNIILQSDGMVLLPATFLYKDFQSDVSYRDFVYSKFLDKYLVVNSGMENLLVYRNDSMVSKDGEFPLVFPSDTDKIKSPEGIAIDSKGNIYIVEWANHRVSVFSNDGSYLRSFGEFGRNVSTDVGKPVHFVFPTRIAIAEDTEGILVDGKRIYRDPQIFVADRYGIQLVDVHGNYLDTPVSSGVDSGSFYDIVVRGYGTNARLYVVDRKEGKIKRFVAKPLEVN